MFFSLNSWQLALLLVVVLFGATAARAPRRARAQPSRGDAARAVRGGAGRAPDAGRAAPRLYPGDGGDALRGAPGGRGRRLQCDRDGVPPSPDAARADALGLAAALSARTPTRASLSPTRCPAVAMRSVRSPENRRSSGSSGASPASRSRARPVDSAPRLYLESLNVMIDMQTTRVAALNNRVPSGDLARRGARSRRRARR